MARLGRYTYLHRLLIAFGLLWGFGVTLLRGLRRPNDWAEAHWLITYDFGFLKRALPGTLLKLLISSPKNAEIAITIIASILTAAFYVVLIALSLSILERHLYSPNAVLAVAVYLTSPFIVMISHLNGYFDSQIILLTILALILTLRGHRWAPAIVVSISLLIHETVFVFGFPSVLWATLLMMGWNAIPVVPISSGRIARHLAPFLLPFAVALILFASQSFYIDATVIEQTLTERLYDIPFIQNDQNVIVPRAFAKSFVAHFQSQSPRFWDRLLSPEMLVTVVPSLAALLTFAGYTSRKGQMPGWLIALGLLLPVLPLGLFLIAWDVSRIWTYPLMVSFLTLWTISRILQPTRPLDVNSAILALLCGGVVVANLFSRIPLMDWRVERFSNLLRLLLYSPLLIVVILAIAQSLSNVYTNRNKKVELDSI